MLPLLEIAANGQTHKFSDAVQVLAKKLNLSDDELCLLLPSGRYPIFRSRVGWAKTYLTKALLLELPSRGTFRITARGQAILGGRPSRIDDSLLFQFPEFAVFKQRPSSERRTRVSEDVATPEEKTPDELLEYAHLELQKSLRKTCFSRLKRVPRNFLKRW